MLSERELYDAAAKIMIARYDELAQAEAFTRAELRRVAGDEGEAIWLRIVAAIEVLEQPEPGPDERVH